MKRFKHRFEQIEKLVVNDEVKDQYEEQTGAIYEGHVEIDWDKIHELEDDGYELVQMVRIDDVDFQFAWFKKEIDECQKRKKKFRRAIGRSLTRKMTRHT